MGLCVCVSVSACVFVHIRVDYFDLNIKAIIQVSYASFFYLPILKFLGYIHLIAVYLHYTESENESELHAG